MYTSDVTTRSTSAIASALLYYFTLCLPVKVTIAEEGTRYG